MSQELLLDGKNYISSKRAAEISGYAQDYIGQLARKQLIDARRIGGLWYVLMESLESYKRVAETYKPQPPVFTKDQSYDLESSVSFDGKEYLSAGKAAEVSGYNQDYVGQLARAGSVLSKQIGNRWYVERQSLMGHKKEKDALLAEVQTQAVGIRAEPVSQAERLSNASYSVPHEPMRYFTETADLIPDLANASFSRGKGTYEEAKRADLETKISIRTMAPAEVHEIRREEERAVRTNTVGSRHRKGRNNSFLVATAGALATIVIVLTVGFGSIRSDSTYTLANRLSNAALAGEVTVLLQKAAGFLEEHLVPQLQYVRK